MTFRTILKGIMFLVVPCFLFPTAAMAYLDPSAGSYYMQVMFGSWLGVAFAFAKFRGKIVATIRRLLQKVHVLAINKTAKQRLIPDEQTVSSSGQTNETG